MRSSTWRLEDLRNVILNLGFVGENLHTRQIFDCKKMFDQYPQASVSMTVTPPEGEPYPGTIERDGDLVIWDVKDSDLVAEGDGEIQIVFTQSPHIARSYNARTHVCRSQVPTGNVPSGLDDYITRADQLLDQVEDTFPAGGTTGQVLAKKSDADYDTEWVDQGGGTEDYEELENLPQIGGVTLKGNKSLHDLGAATEEAVSEKYTKPSGGIPASDLASGVIPDPTSIIDDTAGDGDTDKVWSADKSADTASSLLTEITNAQEAIDEIPKFKADSADILCFKNLLDNQKWENGGIDPETGVDRADNASIRSKDLTPIKDETFVAILGGSVGYVLYVYEYASDGSYKGRKSLQFYAKQIYAAKIALDAGTKKVRFTVYASNVVYDTKIACIKASECYNITDYFNLHENIVKAVGYHCNSVAVSADEIKQFDYLPQANTKHLYKASSVVITTDGTGYVGAEFYIFDAVVGATINVKATRSSGNQWAMRVLFYDKDLATIGTNPTSNTSELSATVPAGTRMMKVTLGACWSTALSADTQVTFSNVEIYYSATDINSKIGNLANLATEDQTSIVNAVNEVVARQDKDIRFPTNWMFDVGHQGFYEEAPASSVASFCRAKAHGYNTLECDIRLTSDNEFVICHNDYLPSDTSYKISQHTYEELYENQNLGSYNGITQKIMKFKEMVQLAKTLDMRLFVELKSTLTQQQIADIIEIAELQGMSERVYWMADVKNTSSQYAGYFRTADPSCNLLINFNRSYSEFANFVIQGHPEKTYCYAWGGYIDDTIINTFKVYGLQMVAWCVSYDYFYPELTTDELIKAEIRRVINCGAVGMCLDKWSLTEVLQEPYADYLE